MLLAASITPLAHLGYVFINFESLVEKGDLLGESGLVLQNYFLIGLIAIYAWLVKNNPDISGDHQTNWYVAILVFVPVTGPYYWFKHLWPGLNK